MSIDTGKKKNSINIAQIKEMDKNSIKLFTRLMENTQNQLINLNTFTQKKNQIDEEISSLFDPVLIKNLKSLYDGYLQEFSEIRHHISQDYVQQVKITIDKILKQNKPLILGSKLLNDRKIYAPIYESTIINSISLDYYQKIQNTLFSQENFISIKKQIKKYYKSHLDEEIKKELKKVPIKLDKDIINDYKRAYYKIRVSFEDFIHQGKNKNIDNSKLKSKQHPSDENKAIESENLRKKFEEALEKKKFEQLKEKQLKSFDNYQKYFNMNERDLRRAKRKATNRSRDRSANLRKKYDKSKKGDK